MTQAAKKQETAQDDFLEFTISGSYYNSKKETIDFDKVVGRIPACDEENGVGSMHVRGRFAAKWIKDAVNADGDPKYPDRIEKLRQVFIDDVKPVKGTLSLVGKSIKDLSNDELQELAVLKDLRYIPLPNSGMSRRDMLIRAYVDYSERVLKVPMMKKSQEPEFNFAKLPDIMVDGEQRIEVGGKITNDDVINQEMDNTNDLPPHKRFTLPELKKLADERKIEYPADVTFDQLYNFMFADKG